MRYDGAGSVDECPGPGSGVWSIATSRGLGCSTRIRINALRHDSRQEPYAVVPHVRICAALAQFGVPQCVLRQEGRIGKAELWRGLRRVLRFRPRPPGIHAPPRLTRVRGRFYEVHLLSTNRVPCLRCVYRKMGALQMDNEVRQQRRFGVQEISQRRHRRRLGGLTTIGRFVNYGPLSGGPVERRTRRH